MYAKVEPVARLRAMAGAALIAALLAWVMQ